MFQRVVIAVCSIAFLLFGLAFALIPSEITALVTGAQISPIAATDVRAIYGGMSLGLAVFFYLCWRRGSEMQRVGLLAAMWTFALCALALLSANRKSTAVSAT